MELEVPVIPRISLRYPETGLDIPVSADSAPSSTHLLRYTRPLVSLLLLSHLPMQYGFAVGVMRRHRTQTAAPMSLTNYAACSWTRSSVHESSIAITTHLSSQHSTGIVRSSYSTYGLQKSRICIHPQALALTQNCLTVPSISSLLACDSLDCVRKSRIARTSFSDAFSNE